MNETTQRGAGHQAQCPQDEQDYRNSEQHKFFLIGLPASNRLMDYIPATGGAMVMLLITLVTPLMSVASLVTRLTSAALAAMPPTVTTPSVVETEVRKALVE